MNDGTAAAGAYERPKIGLEVALAMFKSPAEKGQIPSYVLSEMSHRAGGPESGLNVYDEHGVMGADPAQGKKGRRPHPISATTNTAFGPAVQRVSDPILFRYRAAVDSLWRQVVAEDEDGARRRAVGPLEIVDLLLRRVPELRPSTWNTSRAAVLYWLEGMADDPEAMQARVIMLAGCPKDGFKGPKLGTTATRYSSKSQRKRTFAKRDFDRLLRYLDRRAEVSSRDISVGLLVGAWLRAGLAAGLRPVEWVEATWVDEDKTRLQVKTAKQRRQQADWTAGLARLELEPVGEGVEQGEPKYRLVSIDESDRAAVDDFMVTLRRLMNAGEEFDLIYMRARRYLWSSSRAVFGKDGPKFTLYQMRGQFGANRKARQGVVATAAEMGNSPLKASSYYGRAIYAHPSGRGGGDKPADRQSASDSERVGNLEKASGRE
ncbi:hypothetical protein [Cupriavidus necator]|uniref:hypothetical protein n=1 Tax=Cupriavidus necator TaxID=106590 RepID=UPI000AF30CC0|nr:hypothetical protein [Cupriavidus necator]